jgi:hypothetical protein
MIKMLCLALKSLCCFIKIEIRNSAIENTVFTARSVSFNIKYSAVTTEFIGRLRITLRTNSNYFL